MASLAKICLTGCAKNMLVIFWNFTSTYIMTIKKMHKSARKLKCFQTNTASKIKLLIIRKIRFSGFLVSLTVPHNLSKNATINKLKKIK